jgi:hypothetical protein
MVSFPASATLLNELKGFSDAQYGLIFIPQIITTIAGSLAAGGLARTLGLKRLLAAVIVAGQKTAIMDRACRMVLGGHAHLKG